MTKSANIWTRSRGDMAADNRRLYDVAKQAAKLVARYTWTDDVQRQFEAEPVHLPVPFGLIDIRNEWRALFEALIVAGIIEPDHLGVPLDQSDAVFLRVQEYVGGGVSDYWRTVSAFEVIPGARTYAMADAAAIEAYYKDTSRAVRVVREVMPAAARVEYLNGDRTRVNHVAVIGMIQAGALIELSTGYAAISEWTENPDDVVGAAFWPARIVLQGVPGPRGPAGPAGDGGGGGFGQTFGAVVGGAGGLWVRVNNYVPGVGYSLDLNGPDGYQPDPEYQGLVLESVAEAVDAAVRALRLEAADGRLYVVRFDPDMGSWELSGFEGGTDVDINSGVVVSMGAPVLHVSGLHFVSQGLAMGAGDAWITSGAAGGGTGGYAFTVSDHVPGVGLQLVRMLDGVPVDAPMAFATLPAAMATGAAWLADMGADAGRWEVVYDASAEGPDKYVRRAYAFGVEDAGWLGAYFEMPALGDLVADMAPFVDQFINAGFGVVPEWVQQSAASSFELVEFGALVWPMAPGYAGGDVATVIDQQLTYLQVPGFGIRTNFESRLVVHALGLSPVDSVVAAVASVGAGVGSWGVVDSAGVLVATLSREPGGALVRSWVPSADVRQWVKIDGRNPGGGVMGGGLWWVSQWDDRSEWGRAIASTAAIFGGPASAALSGITVNGAPYVPQIMLLATSGGVLPQPMPEVATGAAWANRAGADYFAAYHPEWANDEALIDPLQAWAAAWAYGENHFPSGFSILRIYASWKPEISA